MRLSWVVQCVVWIDGKYLEDSKLSVDSSFKIYHFRFLRGNSKNLPLGTIEGNQLENIWQPSNKIFRRCIINPLINSLEDILATLKNNN
jgi:hypothetical protein